MSGAGGLAPAARGGAARGGHEERPGGAGSRRNEAFASRALRRPVTWLAVGLALLLNAPSLDLGLIADDVSQQVHVLAHLAGEGARGQAWEMFGYRSTPSDVGLAIEAGVTPWWTSPDLQVAMFRPLAAATHFLDYTLWPTSDVAMHLHNVAWYAALVLALAALYGRLMGAGRAAAIALVLYAVDESHVTTVSWIAGRNTVMTAFFVVLALWAHDAWRRNDSARAGMLAPVWLALASASSEGGIAALAYLIAYAAFVDGGTPARRALSLAPAVAVTAVHHGLLRVLGYGVRDSGLYLDPLQTPGAFLAQLPERMALMGCELWSVPSTVGRHVPAQFHLPLLAVAFALLAGLAGVLVARARHDRMVRFWLAGSLLSLVPVCTVAVSVSPRLLLVPGIGAFALIGILVFEGFEGTRRTLAGRAGGAVLLAVHGLVPAMTGPGVVTQGRALGQYLAHGAESLAQTVRPDDDAVAVLQTPQCFMSTVHVYHYAMHPDAKPVYLIGASLDPVEVRRDGNGFVLTPEGGYLREPWSLAVRPPWKPFLAGSIYRMTHTNVTVQAVTPDGRPARIAVRPTGTSKVAWIVWRSDLERYERLDLGTLPPSFRILPRLPRPM